MKKVILYSIIILLPCLEHVKAQNVSEQIMLAQYYFDTDPGVGIAGNGGILSPPISGVFPSVFNINIPNTLSVGFHTIYFRFMDDQGSWSVAERRSFFITEPIIVENITELQYFFDMDPGPGVPGNGAIIQVAQTDLINQTFQIVIPTLSEGYHTLYYRMKNADGSWSVSERRSFYVHVQNNTQYITEVQYYFSTDPGVGVVGNGDIITIPNEDTVDLNLNLNVPAGLTCNPAVYMRFKDNFGRWSVSERVQFENPVTNPFVDFDVVRTDNSVFIQSQMQNLTGFSWNYGDGSPVDVTAQNPSHAYTVPDDYNICLTGTSSSCGSEQKCVMISMPGVDRVIPNYSGNSGWCFVDVYGNKFVPGTTVKLFKSGFTDIIPTTIDIIDLAHIRLSFEFDNTPVGMRDVVVTIPGEGVFTLTDGFDIQPLEQFDPSIDITTTSLTLLNRWNNMKAAIKNNSNQTGYGVLVTLTFPGYVTAELQNEINVSYLDPSVVSELPASGFQVYKEPGEDDSILVTGFVIPMLRPGEVFYLNSRFKTPIQGNLEIKGRVIDEPFFDNSLFDQSGNFITTCDIIPPCINSGLEAIGEFPGGGCFVGGFDIGCGILDFIDQGATTDEGYSLAGSISNAFLDCGISTIPGVRIGFKTAAKYAGKVKDISEGLLEDGSPPCIIDCIAGDDDGQEVTGINSFDPNLKQGPGTANSANHISSNNTIYYNVYFENASTASAPANEVLITDQLDTAHLDLSSFRFTGFTIGDSTFENSIERDLYAGDYDLRPARNCILRTIFEVDSNGLATWKFISLDPVTYGELSNPLDGFLPPNVSDPEGQAFVTYHIDPKPGLANNTVIENEATIVFDFNPPILTPAWINTIDTEKPSSSVLALPPVTHDTTFVIKWAGTDPAGIEKYSVFVSDNDGPFFKLSVANGKDSLELIGQVGHKYEFYSIAVDNAGNEEDAPVDPENSPDAVTIIDTTRTVYYLDSDNDGHGSMTETTLAFEPPTGYVSSNDDCDDFEETVYPGATEICNSIDEDCDGSVTDGCANLALGLYLQGFYTGGGLMDNFGAGGFMFVTNVPGAAVTDVDSVKIAAMESFAPYAVVDEQTGILQTDGNVSVTFGPAVIDGNSYYIRVRHQSSVETWSANAVPISSFTTYSFKTSASTAYLDNLALTSDNLFYAIYCGDVNQDGAVDGGDFLELDPEIQIGNGGYNRFDVNGDGAVDGGDFLMLDPNIQLGIGAAVP